MRYDKEYIQQKLRQSPLWRAKALATLYAMQSEAERSAKETLHHNSEGFGQSDARRLSDYAEFAKKRPMTRNMDYILSKVLPKYWRQLVKAIAERNAGRVLKQTKSYVELKPREAT